MVNFLFWNIRGKDLRAELKQLCYERDIDILILAECDLGIASLLEALNESSTQTYVAPFNPSDKLIFITRYPMGALVPVSDDGGISIRRLSPPIGIDVLVIALHLPSKMHQKGVEQAMYAVHVGNAIAEAELTIGHDRSLVIGDLNIR